MTGGQGGQGVIVITYIPLIPGPHHGFVAQLLSWALTVPVLGSIIKTIHAYLVRGRLERESREALARLGVILPSHS